MSLIAQDQTNVDSVLSALGELQSWTPSGGSAITFTGIPDVSSALIELGAGRVISSDARVVGKRSVIGTAKKGDAIALTSARNGISAASYVVEVPFEHDPEYGPGFTRLELRKTS